MRYCLLSVAMLCGLIGVQSLQADPTPTFYEGFDNGKTDGPVGKAGSRLEVDPLGIVNMERGTLAFHVQSAKEPREREWGGLGGVTTDRDAGYWSMLLMFQTRKQEFLFNLFDVGNYSPPMVLPSIFGRWKAGQWHHLAAVWDRDEGVRVYEDGKEIFSNWGEHRWQWNHLPRRLSLAGPLDEVYVYAEPLTAKQIAQLANGQKATGTAIPISSPAERRDRELARFGWNEPNVGKLPTVSPDSPIKLTFARINSCVDAKRPVAYPYEGLLNSTWPSFKYGASTRGQKLEIALDENQDYDHVRIFSHRNFVGRLVHATDSQPEALATFDIPHAMFWHEKLPGKLTDTQLVLERAYGQMGHIDFYRVEPAKPATGNNVESYQLAIADEFPEGELGNVVKGQTPRRHWNPVNAMKDSAKSHKLKTPAFGGFQAFTAPHAGAKGYIGIEVELVVEGLTKPTPVHVEVTEPVDPQRVWLLSHVVLQPKGAGPQKYTVSMYGRPVINMPERKYRKYLKDGKYSDTDINIVPGIAFGIKVTAANDATWLLGDKGSAVRLITAPKETIVEKAADDQVEWMREAYAERMEGHLYGDPRIMVPLVWLGHFAPDRMKVRQMWERVDTRTGGIMGVKVEKIVMPEIKNDTGAPDWAFWQMQAVDRHRKHLHWMIDERQIWTGEFGGIWNDDSTHVENWMGYMLCMDDERKIHKAMRKYWYGLWNYQLLEGVGTYHQDSSHYSEEGSSNLGMRLLIEYGDPVAYSWAMQSASHFPYWVNEKGDGEYSFKGDFLGPRGVWTEGAFAYNWEQGQRFKIPLVPLAYLIWYNDHPLASKYMRGLGQDPAGNPGTIFGGALAFTTDWELARKKFSETLNKKPNRRYGPNRAGHNQALNVVELTDKQRKLLTNEYEPQKPIMHYWGSKNTEQHWFDWKVTGDERFLVDSYKRVVEWFYSHDWLNSEAMPSMDRNPLPRGGLIRSRIGATPANRGSSGNMWPMHAISFEKGANDVASLVTDNLENRFAVRFYAFTDKPHDMTLRAWRCNGTFKVTLANDKNNDGKPEGNIWQKQMKLDRGATIDLTIPARQGTLLTVTPVKVERLNFDRPDPAISFDTCELSYGDHLVIKVHNIGRKPVDDVLVRVTDKRSGKVVINGEVRTGPIEAPLDLKPRFAIVEVKNINCNAWGEFVIEIDPDGKIDDANRYNNRVDFRYRSTFDLPDGWH